MLYGGRSGEHEVSLASAAAVFANLDRARYEPVPLRIEKDGRWSLADRQPTAVSAAEVIEQARLEAARPTRGGRGIGAKGKDNGVLIVVAVDDRKIKIEVGYDLEQFVTDGFAGETIRSTIAPEFKNGNYGAGLLAGTTRIVNRIAEGRGITLQDVPQTGGGSREEKLPDPYSAQAGQGQLSYPLRSTVAPQSRAPSPSSRS